jgi:hypothetical protein
VSPPPGFRTTWLRERRGQKTPIRSEAEYQRQEIEQNTEQAAQPSGPFEVDLDAIGPQVNAVADQQVDDVGLLAHAAGGLVGGYTFGHPGNYGELLAFDHNSADLVDLRPGDDFGDGQGFGGALGGFQGVEDDNHADDNQQVNQAIF